MSHLVSPVAHRVGKSFPWLSNIISPKVNKLVPVSTLPNQVDINSVLRSRLRRDRLFLVKTVLSKLNHSYLQANVLFLPRIKKKPRPDSWGRFGRRVIAQPFNWESEHFNSAVHIYITERRFKVYQFPRKRRIKQLNKWLTRRMLRGSTFHNWCYWWKRRHRVIRKINKHKKKRHYLFYLSAWKTLFKQIKLRSWGRKLLYSYRWWITRLHVRQKLPSSQLSHYCSSIFNYPIKVCSLNIFAYLASKHLVGYRSHQEHFWNRRFRHFRFYYDSYYDIVNSFFILGLVSNTELLVLDILKRMLPRVHKIPRLLYLLDAILKHMTQIKNNFSCFRITLTGKIGGGTKRTRTSIIGFGRFPVQSINVNGSTVLTNYTHKFGEFGMKFIMCRRLKGDKHIYI